MADLEVTAVVDDLVTEEDVEYEPVVDVLKELCWLLEEMTGLL